MSISVYISNDATTLGEAATERDVVAFADNLASHLSALYARDVSVIPTADVCQKRGCPENATIDRYVRDLLAGDGWLDFVDFKAVR